MPRSIAISVDWPPLPEGYSSTPDGFKTWLAENAIFTADGDSTFTGQIGGNRPTQDVGIYFSPNSVEMFIDGEYQPITDVPIGSVLMWPSGLAAPENYLFAEGQSLLKDDYPFLFDIIGTTWGEESPTSFNMPDFRGRYPVGANGAINTGPGDFKYQGITARMRDKDLGNYYGFNFPKNEATYPAGPTSKQGAKRYDLLDVANKRVGTTEAPQTPVRFLIRYR